MKRPSFQKKFNTHEVLIGTVCIFMKRTLRKHLPLLCKHRWFLVNAVARFVHVRNWCSAFETRLAGKAPTRTQHSAFDVARVTFDTWVVCLFCLEIYSSRCWFRGWENCFLMRLTWIFAEFIFCGCKVLLPQFTCVSVHTWFIVFVLKVCFTSELSLLTSK